MKNYKGRIDSLYTKWELYLYRLFKLSKWMREELRFTRIAGPKWVEVIDPIGYEGEKFTIPPNPFLLRAEDEKIFQMFYDPLQLIGNSTKNLQNLQFEVWNRIFDIKEFLGIVANTRFLGEKKPENRLCNQLDVYLQYPSKFPTLWKLIFDDDPIFFIRAFQHFLRDRSKRTEGLNINKYF